MTLRNAFFPRATRGQFNELTKADANYRFQMILVAVDVHHPNRRRARLGLVRLGTSRRHLEVKDIEMAGNFGKVR
jgi:hypothetical protein